MITSRSNQIILPFVFWDPANAETHREPKGIYEMRSYKLRVRVFSGLIPRLFPWEWSLVTRLDLQYITAGWSMQRQFYALFFCVARNSDRVGTKLVSRQCCHQTYWYTEICRAVHVYTWLLLLANNFLSKGQMQPSDWLSFSQLYVFIGSKESNIVRRRVLEDGSLRLGRCIKYSICGVSPCNLNVMSITQWKCLLMKLLEYTRLLPINERDILESTGLVCGRKLL